MRGILVIGIGTGNPGTKTVEFGMPQRDADAGYREAVDDWHARIADIWPVLLAEHTGRTELRRCWSGATLVALRQHAAHPRPAPRGGPGCARKACRRAPTAWR